MPFKILRGDITKVKADAIVNAANENLWEGGGVCGAIFAEAGSEALAAECGRIGHCDTGSAVITSACGLKNAKYIVHAVGPVWRGGLYGEERQLRSCYAKALELAAEHGCESIAFPLISAGIYGYPREAAFDVAVSAIREFLKTHEIDVSLVLFDRSRLPLSADWFRELSRYLGKTKRSAPRAQEETESSLGAAGAADIAEAFSEDALCCDSRESFEGLGDLPSSYRRREPETSKAPSFPPRKVCATRSRQKRNLLGQIFEEMAPSGASEKSSPAPAKKTRYRVVPPSDTLEDFLKGSAPETFQQALLRLIKERGLTDPQVYKRANVNRWVFSKIRGNPDYHPKKETALAFAIALELDLEDTDDFLSRAGYSLSESTGDRIVEFFILHGEFDIDKINIALYDYDQKLLPA